MCKMSLTGQIVFINLNCCFSAGLFWDLLIIDELGELKDVILASLYTRDLVGKEIFYLCAVVIDFLTINRHVFIRKQLKTKDTFFL